MLTLYVAVWVDWWTAANERNPEAGVGMYLGVYAFLGVIGVVFMTCACWFVVLLLSFHITYINLTDYGHRLMFINMVSKSSLRLHEDVLSATLK